MEFELEKMTFTNVTFRENKSYAFYPELFCFKFEFEVYGLKILNWFYQVKENQTVATFYLMGETYHPLPLSSEEENELLCYLDVQRYKLVEKLLNHPDIRYETLPCKQKYNILQERKYCESGA